MNRTKMQQKEGFSKAETGLRLKFGITHDLKIILNKLEDLKPKLKSNRNQNTSKPSTLQWKYNNESSNSNVKKRNSKNLYECEFCSKKVVKTSKNGHIRICKLNPKQQDKVWAAQQRSFKCTMCEFATLERSNLTVHLRTHTGEKPFPCSLCNKWFRRKGDLHEHIFRHTGEKPYSCEFCKTGFSKHLPKINHENSCKLNPKRVEKQRRFKCHICDYSSAFKSALLSHVKRHSEDKPFGCPLCPKFVTTLGGLRSHIRTHTKEKPFKCHQCTYSASQSSTLANHIEAIHTDGALRKRFPCQTCSKESYTKAELKRHNRTHTGEKLHTCYFCKRRFAGRTAKNNHEKICKLNPKQKDPEWVEKQKKFKCQLCGYATIFRYSLSKHLRTHAGDQPFRCHLCDFKAARQNYLKNHRKLCHKNAT